MSPHGAFGLLDHPGIPLADSQELPSGVLRLRPAERWAAAAQLLAALAVLVEHDLWPGFAPLRRPLFRRVGGEVRLRLWGHARPLGLLCRRLGGGRTAFERLCRRGVELVWAVCGLGTAPDLPTTTGVERYLDWALDRLEKPFPRAVARALWAVRLEPLAAARPGEVAYHACGANEVAERLAAELVARARAAGRPAWRVEAGLGDETAPWPTLEAGGLLAVFGALADADLATAERAAAAGAGVVAVGRFPPGWEPSPAVRPVPGPAVLTLGHGKTAGAAVVVLDPSQPSERDGLTWLASHRFHAPEPAPQRDEPALRLLRLAPEGVPEALLLAVAGGDRGALEALERSGEAVRRGDRWRPVRRLPLPADPLHRLLTQVEPPGSARRMVREVMAGGESGELEDWLRRRLERLETRAVRELLAPCAVEALPPRLRALLAQACLLELDPGGARRALAGLEDPEGETVRAWLEAMDRDGSWRPRPLADAAVAAEPLAVAAAALECWVWCAWTGKEAPEPYAEAVRAACDRLRGPLRRWVEIGATWIDEPERLGDRAWRRRVVGDHPVLVLRWLHFAGLAERSRGRLRAARRAFLAALRRATRGAGMAGLLELDLGAVELAAGRTAAAELHHLRALRLLEAAGFRGRTEVVRFNLAVAALDRYDLENAERELGRFREDDPYVIAERARLALAKGDEETCRRWRARLAPDAAETALAEATALLDGVLALLEGDRSTARRELARGGAEGRAWLALLAALEGGPVPPKLGEDGWGVVRAARWIAEGGGRPAWRNAEPELRDAVAGALLARLGVWRPGRDGRYGALARRLEAAQLPGWRRWLYPAVNMDEALRPLVRLAEEGPSALDRDGLLAPLLDHLGLSGVEVRSALGGEVLWRWGTGEPAAEAVRGSVVVTALGTAGPSGPFWQLLVQLLAATVPAVPAQEDGELGLVGQSRAMQRLRDDLSALAPTPLTVLLLGETGVGKELAARALHRLSGRRGRFVAVNVAALPESLVEAELFGAVRGAFTGAVGDRTGLARAAHGGTLFLDEVGELEPRLQAKLLRFLESREVRPVGSDRSERVDVRVVAATHRDLERMVAEGSFRADLYYRIATAVVRVPPLRERRGDIPLLRAYFETEAVRAGASRPAGWSPVAEQALDAYSWPGNVRELRHVVEVALARARGGVVLPEHLAVPPTGDRPVVRVRRWNEALEAVRRELIQEALAATGGNRTKAARRLGISRQTLLYHLRILGIDAP